MCFCFYFLIRYFLFLIKLTTKKHTQTKQKQTKTNQKQTRQQYLTSSNNFPRVEVRQVTCARSWMDL